VAADELFNVDAPIAERAAVPVRLGDLRLERDDAFEARAEICRAHPAGSVQNANRVRPHSGPDPNRPFYPPLKKPLPCRPWPPPLAAATKYATASKKNSTV